MKCPIILTAGHLTYQQSSSVCLWYIAPWSHQELKLITLQLQCTGCGLLTPLNNGSIEVDYSGYGERANFSCSKGYGLKGAKSRTCQRNGKWSSKQPICEGTSMHITLYLGQLYSRSTIHWPQRCDKCLFENLSVGFWNYCWVSNQNLTSS